MKTKFTLKDYNNILKEYKLKCVPSDNILNYDIISKRKNNNHECLICGCIFKMTPSKLLKLKKCIYDHPVIKTKPNIIKPTPIVDIMKVMTKDILTPKEYKLKLPIKIKLKETVKKITTVIRHKCNKCNTIFRISPCDMYDRKYKCPKCNR